MKTGVHGETVILYKHKTKEGWVHNRTSINNIYAMAKTKVLNTFVPVETDFYTYTELGWKRITEVYRSEVQYLSALIFNNNVAIYAGSDTVIFSDEPGLSVGDFKESPYMLSLISALEIMDQGWYSGYLLKAEDAKYFRLSNHKLVSTQITKD